MNKILSVITATLLASCTATTNWTKPGATQASLNADKAQCEYESQLATANVDSPVRAGVREVFLERACMKAHGWWTQ